jgi:hypothetical protein
MLPLSLASVIRFARSTARSPLSRHLFVLGAHFPASFSPAHLAHSFFRARLFPHVLIPASSATSLAHFAHSPSGGHVKLTAKLPGAFLAIVHPHPLYKLPTPSSVTNLTNPRPLIASGFVCILIFNTSNGSNTTSPKPVKEPAAAWMTIFPFFSPNASVKNGFKREPSIKSRK